MSRVRQCNDKTQHGACVLYVMSRDQRVQDNFALYEAQQTAFRLQVPLAVVFCLSPSVGYRSREQYQWMLDGLEQLEKKLNKLSIPFMMLVGKPKDTLMGMMHHTQPAAIYFDFNPLIGPTKLRHHIAQTATCAVFEVDAHNIVPVWEASSKKEVGARTLRPKIHRLLPKYIDDLAPLKRHPHKWPGVVRTIQELKPMIAKIVSDRPSSHQVLQFDSGETAAHKVLAGFIDERLHGYAENRNDPTKDGQSELSPYLHFGQLWSGRAVQEAQLAAVKHPALAQDVAAFIEELVVRRELSDNFCLYNQHYTSLKGAPQWARDSLENHASDKREHVYTRQQLEDGQTHDLAWNATQMQLRQTGKMHGYMRMYWAKKVLEWSATPGEALATLIYLNDFYSIDGGDPNGYVGILWSIAGLHDRPWFDRPIYGVVRYMNDNGLKRKFKIATYQDRWTTSQVKTP